MFCYNCRTWAYTPEHLDCPSFRRAIVLPHLPGPVLVACRFRYHRGQEKCMLCNVDNPYTHRRAALMIAAGALLAWAALWGLFGRGDALGYGPEAKGGNGAAPAVLAAYAAPAAPACPAISTGAEGPFAPVANTVLAQGTHNFTTINIPTGVLITTNGN